MTDRRGWGLPADELRLQLSRHLTGTGLELGPGHHPYVLSLPGTSVRYVDRWEPADNAALFPELGETAEFPKPDIVANLDSDRLSMVPDESEDFVIASHVLEHLADPVAMLDEIARVLRPGGSVLVLLPDRRRTSDERRAGTTLDHLLDDNARGVDEVDDAHLEEFLTQAWQLDLSDPAERARLIEVHRQRSVHVHCWTEPEFFEVIAHGVSSRGHRWELVDLLLTEDAPRSIEFGFVLRRAVADVPPDVLHERLLAARELLLADPARRQRATAATLQARVDAGEDRLRAAEAAARSARDQARSARGEADRLRRRVERYDRTFAPLRNSRLWPYVRTTARRLHLIPDGGAPRSS